MLRISNSVSIPPEEITVRGVRAGGPGGQHVNKASTAVHLFFDVRNSSLPDAYKSRLLARGDRRITGDGVVVIKAQEHRSLEKNRADAMERLRELVRSAGVVRKRRRPTKPSRNARAKRMDAKTKASRTKALRSRVKPE
ncbi:MAG: aminoacyl-tRNA hydrolase [Opitutales bacterium]|nr:aminoacyl-tRNA hydrolase [Opitutales bacterium]